MKKMYISLSCIFLIGCAGSASDYSTSNGRAPILSDSYIDASGNVIDEDSDDDFGPSAPEPNNEAPEGGEDNNNNSDGSGSDTSESGEITTGTGQCMNESDLAVLGDDESSFDSALNDCFETCFTSETSENCITNCLTENSNISNGCAQCYDALMNCYLSSCLQPCSGEDSETECDDCLAENCFPTFTSCSGLDPEDF